VDRVRVEDVGHVRGEVLEPDVLVRRARVGTADEVAAHVLDLTADRLDQRIEVAVLLFVDVHGHARAVGLVLQRHPLEVRDALVADEVEQDVGELLRLEGAALPRDVDVGAGALSELHRPHEGLHLVRIGERLRREEDARELRVQGAHLLLHVGDVLVGDADGAAERRVDVVVELAAVARELGYEDSGRARLELGHVHRHVTRADTGHEDSQPVPTDCRERDGELDDRAPARAERHGGAGGKHLVLGTADEDVRLPRPRRAVDDLDLDVEGVARQDGAVRLDRGDNEPRRGCRRCRAGSDGGGKGNCCADEELSHDPYSLGVL
jgi:hypothetical protein